MRIGWQVIPDAAQRRSGISGLADAQWASGVMLCMPRNDRQLELFAAPFAKSSRTSFIGAISRMNVKAPLSLIS